MDRLEQMFDLQYELNRRIGVDTKELETEEQKTVWIKQYSLALYQELGELVDSVEFMGMADAEAEKKIHDMGKKFGEMILGG